MKTLKIKWFFSTAVLVFIIIFCLFLHLFILSTLIPAAGFLLVLKESNNMTCKIMGFVIDKINVRKAFDRVIGLEIKIHKEGR